MLWCAASRRLTQPRPPPLGRDRSQTAHGGRRSSTTQVSRATRYHIAQNVAGQPAGGLGQCGRRLIAGPQPDVSGRWADVGCSSSRRSVTSAGWPRWSGLVVELEAGELDLAVRVLDGVGEFHRRSGGNALIESWPLSTVRRWWMVAVRSATIAALMCAVVLP